MVASQGFADASSPLAFSPAATRMRNLPDMSRVKTSLPWFCALLVVATLLGGSWYFAYQATILAPGAAKSAAFEMLVTFSRISNWVAALLGPALLLLAFAIRRRSPQWSDAWLVSALAVATAWASLWAYADKYAWVRLLPLVLIAVMGWAWRQRHQRLLRVAAGLVVVALASYTVNHISWTSFARFERAAHAPAGL